MTIEITPREAQYLRFIIRADLEILQDGDDGDERGDAIERVLAQRLMSKLSE